MQFKCFQQLRFDSCNKTEKSNNARKTGLHKIMNEHV